MKAPVVVVFWVAVITAVVLPAITAAADAGTNWWDERNPFDGWTLNEIKAHPGFHAYRIYDPVTRDTICPSQARTSADPGASYAYKWIGYIELPRENSGMHKVVVFDSNGAGVTLIGEGFDPQPLGFIPIWVYNAIDYLYIRGYYDGVYCY